VVVGASLWTWKYKSTPSPAGAAPDQWPHASALPRRPGRPLLVMLAHPRCSCTRASLAELGALLGEVGDSADADVVFVRPDGIADDWIESDLWHTALRMPGVTVVADRGGRETERFGALTSGTLLLYDGSGRLRFSGGVTSARGHVGDNPGRRRVVALIKQGKADKPTSPVFGCDLLGPREPGRGAP
jgi:hypothetical protein